MGKSDEVNIKGKKAQVMNGQQKLVFIGVHILFVYFSVGVPQCMANLTLPNLTLLLCYSYKKKATHCGIGLWRICSHSQIRRNWVERRTRRRITISNESKQTFS